MSDSIIVVIENPDGMLLVHQRTLIKRKYAGLFGVGINARIQAGESNEDAVEKKLRSLIISTMPEYLFLCHVTTPTTREHAEVYRMVKETLLPSDRNMQKTEWMSVEQINDLEKRLLLCPLTTAFYPTFRDKYYIKR